MPPNNGAERRSDGPVRRALEQAAAIILTYVALVAAVRLFGVRAERVLTSPGAPWQDGPPATYGWWLAIGTAVFLLSIAMAAGALGMLVHSLVQSLRARSRGSSWYQPRAEIVVASAVLLGTAVMYLWPPPYQDARRQGLVAVTQRLSPLVSAIERFERDRSSPPSTLRELVPGYLAALPSHPARGCRPLQYTRFGAGARTGWPAWELRMECPHSLFDLDQLFYWPGSQYVAYMHNDRIGAWAYHWD